MKKLSIYLSLGLALLLIVGMIFSCGKPETPAQPTTPKEQPKEEPKAAEPVVIRFANDQPEGNFTEVLCQKWASNFNERAAGSGYTIEVYSGGVLCNIAESVDMVRTGAVDMAFYDLQYAADRDVRFWATGLPFMFKDVDAQFKFAQLVRDTVFNDTMEKGFNQKLVAFSGMDFHTYCGNEPIKTLNDWEGLVIQTASPMEAQTVEALGGASTSMPFFDLVPAMEKGVVDGGVGWNAGAVYLMNWYDAIKHITTAPVSGIFVTVSINKDLFDGMPKEVQDIMVDEGDQFGSQVFQEFQQIMIAAYDECAKAGIEIYDLPDAEMEKWRDATKPVVDDFFSQLEPDVATAIQNAIAEANK